MAIRCFDSQFCDPFTLSNCIGVFYKIMIWYDMIGIQSVAIFFISLFFKSSKRFSNSALVKILQNICGAIRFQFELVSHAVRINTLFEQMHSLVLYIFLINGKKIGKLSIGNYSLRQNYV